MNRKEFAREYLFNLVRRWEALEAERKELLQAATRITAIQAEKAELLSDAQDALAKFNQVFGTSYTLAQVRNWYDARTGTMNMPLPTAVVPNVVGMTEAEASTALTAVGFGVSVVPVPHETAAVGDVVSQMPVANTTITVGTTVMINVSTGPVTP